jgi:hypothetical protein
MPGQRAAGANALCPGDIIGGMAGPFPYLAAVGVCQPILPAAAWEAIPALSTAGKIHLTTKSNLSIQLPPQHWASKALAGQARLRTSQPMQASLPIESFSSIPTGSRVSTLQSVESSWTNAIILTWRYRIFIILVLKNNK